MRKSIVIIFFSVLILTIFLVVAYFLSIGKNKADSYQIYSDAENPNGYPNIVWEDITSGKLLSYLENQERKGKLPLISSGAELISVPGITNAEFFNTNGLAFLQMTGDDVISNKYKNSEIRPFRFVAFFKTELDGTPYFVLIQKWLNPDGSTAFLPLIISESLAVSGNSLSAYYQGLISDDTVYFLDPVLQIKSLEQCKTALPKRESYCDWYFQDPSTNSTFVNIMSEWTRSGNILKEAGKMPMLFSISRLFRD